MSTVVGLYYKAAGLESGGTNSETGLRTGTLVEPAPWVANTSYAVGILASHGGHAWACATVNSDASWTAGHWSDLGACSPAPQAASGTVYTLYFRAIDSVTGLDPVQDSVENITFTPSSNEQVCATYNGSFTGSALQLSVITTGGNQPVYVKQTALEASSPIGLTIGALDWAAGTRCPQVGTVTVGTLDSRSIPLTWADISMSSQGFYEVWRTTANDTTTNMTLVGTVADGSTGYTDNVANSGANAPVTGTAYWYHVRAVDCRGVGLYQSGTVTATIAVTSGALLDLRAELSNSAKNGYAGATATTWYDLSGNALDFTVYYSSGTAGFGGAGSTGDPYYVLTAPATVDHCATHADSSTIDLLNSFTFETWLAAPALPLTTSKILPIFLHGTDAGYGGNLWITLEYIGASDHRLTVKASNGASSYRLFKFTGETVSVGSANSAFGGITASGFWHVVVAHDSTAGAMKIYVNGTEACGYYVVAETTGAGINSAATVRIGGRETTDANSMPGKFAHVRLYGSALTSAQVLANYNATRATFGR